MTPKILYNKYFIAVFCVIAVISFVLIGKINNYEFELKHRNNLEIQEINSDESLREVISKIGAGPTLLVIYTSWCSSCIEKMPAIVRILDMYKEVEPIVISLDTNKTKLASFLVDLLHHGKVSFTPYNVLPAYQGRLAYALAGKGVYFNGKIPYVAVFDKNTIPITNLPTTQALLNAVESVTTRLHK